MIDMLILKNPVNPVCSSVLEYDVIFKSIFSARPGRSQHTNTRPPGPKNARQESRIPFTDVCSQNSTTDNQKKTIAQSTITADENAGHIAAYSCVHAAIFQRKDCQSRQRKPCLSRVAGYILQHAVWQAIRSGKIRGGKDYQRRVAR